MERNNTKEAFSNLSAYLEEIGRIDLLTPDQERALARRIQAGDEIARQRFIEANLRLVVHVARRYAGGDPEKLLDFIQEGNLGLFRAVDRFDPELGYRFSTYAMYWIRQTIRRYMNRESVIRLPEHIVTQVGQMRRTRQYLFQELGRQPTEAEIADELGISARKVYELEEYSQAAVSLDQPVGSESEETGMSLGDLIKDLDAPQPEFIAGHHLLRAQVREVLKELPSREQEILGLRFGLHDNVPHTLEEVGKKFGITRERIRQIQNKALRQLREHKSFHGYENMRQHP